ncbi:hypothetical protein GA715_09315 [Leuconostoc mesenteroides]|uniref:hypothetical protein n=1 Tax=Leuconostoc mesenteroides TaxID=1245 RepID=UPI0029550361|nr:hypothetical protein [Leuconostoc mesenteroides]MDV7740334.1 hypothetical protein [Leuconostoc mesenteroides]
MMMILQKYRVLVRIIVFIINILILVMALVSFLWVEIKLDSTLTDLDISYLISGLTLLFISMSFNINLYYLTKEKKFIFDWFLISFVIIVVPMLYVLLFLII